MLCTLLMALGWTASLILAFALGPIALAWEPSPQEEESYRIRVAFPLSSTEEDRILRQLSEIANLPQTTGIPTVILEFRAASTKAQSDSNEETVGSGTSFVKALGLARWLTSVEGNRVRSVAYLPRSIRGHAVLIALGCKEIMMAPTATLGEANLNETSSDGTVKQAYRDINQARQLFPVAAIDSFLEAGSQLYQVELRSGGTKFVLAKELEELKDASEVLSENQIGLPGQSVVLSGKQLRGLRWITHLIQDPSELSQLLELKGIPKDPTSFEGPWTPAVFELRGNVTTRGTNQLLRAMEDATKKGANLLLFDIDSPGGAVEESIRLAQVIASLDSNKIRTVGFISGVARGDASLIPLACDSLYIAKESSLGGSGEATISVDDVVRLQPTLAQLAQATDRTIGEFEAPLSNQVEVFRYATPEGAQMWASATSIQKEGMGNWTKGEQLKVGEGLRSEQLLKLHWARAIRESREEAVSDYGVETLPDPLRSNPVELFVQRLAEQSWLPPLLITIGFFALIMELSTPGATLPGFVAAICFLLFFWMRFLNGTVEWLEVLLFVGGGVFIAIELFLLPGFGVFGFGGILMVFMGMILASQTFLWPTNAYQMNEMAWNMSQVAGACIGVFIGLFLLRNQLENLPFFRWLRLDPDDENREARLEREVLAHFDHLSGKTGITVTSCVPSGKAKIGDEVVNVLSDGILIEEGVEVRVVEVRGNTIVVTSLHR